MAAVIQWLGHNCWLIESAGHRVLLDPFLDESPTAPCKAADVKCEFILVSHGHSDHIADCVKIADHTGAKVISSFEICEWLGKQGVANTDPGNLGGGIQQPFGRVEFTLAHHSSQLPDGGYGGNPMGFLLELPAGNVYFACDTALFTDMALIGTHNLALAVLPIGDRYTMGPEASIDAVRMLKPRRVAPCHYNTWPPIAQDAEAWARRVRKETQADPIVLQPGGTITLE